MTHLTDQEIARFETFGYLAFPGLLADRISEITDAFEDVWTHHGGGHAGKQHEGASRSCIVPFIDQSEVLCSLLDDPHILSICCTLLGEDFNYMGSDGNYYVGDTPWHSDGWHQDIRHIKLAFYLDALTAESGALRVIPGSHQVEDRYAQSLHTHLARAMDSFAVGAREMPAAVLATHPGDVVVFNHNIKHASFGGGTRRRMFTINCCRRYPKDRVNQLRDYIRGYSRFWIDRVYSETMVRTADPARMKHLEQVMGNDDHLADLSAQARREMAEPSRG